MNTIPTAKEFRISQCMSIEQDLFNSDLEYLMIEFAKLHVEAALNNANENAKFYMLKKSQYGKNRRWKRATEEEVDLFKFNVKWKVSKSSIVNSYPLDQIK